MVVFAEANSVYPVNREAAAAGTDLNNWYHEVRKLVAPRNLSLAEVEALVRPLLAEHPDVHHFHYLLGCAHATHGNWDTAYEHLDAAIERTPVGSELWFRMVFDCAPVAVHTGHMERYREYCDQVVAHGFAFHEDGSRTRRTTKMFCIGPNEINRERIAKHIDAQPVPPANPHQFWHGLSKAMADYRCEDYQTLIEDIGFIESMPEEMGPHIMLPAKMLLAMSYHQLGEAEKAEALFDRAEAYFFGSNYLPEKDSLYTNAWQDYLYARVIYDEAKRLIGEEE